MKILIIGSDILVNQALEGACRQAGFSKIVTCGHDKALTTFLEADPTHVIISDYSEVQRILESDGFDTWQILTNAAKECQVFVRVGHEDCDRPDYIKLPFESLELKERLRITA